MQDSIYSFGTAWPFRLIGAYAIAFAGDIDPHLLKRSSQNLPHIWPIKSEIDCYAGAGEKMAKKQSLNYNQY